MFVTSGNYGNNEGHKDDSNSVPNLLGLPFTTIQRSERNILSYSIKSEQNVPIGLNTFCSHSIRNKVFLLGLIGILCSDSLREKNPFS